MIARITYIQSILDLINIDFNSIKNRPPNLKSNRFAVCTLCENTIQKYEPYISFGIYPNINYVCVYCLREKDSYGKYHNKSLYFDEIKYANKYIISLNNFTSIFNSKSKSKIYQIDEYEIRKIFAKKINKVANYIE